jgi:hypothetical protein
MISFTDDRSASVNPSASRAAWYSEVWLGSMLVVRVGPVEGARCDEALLFIVMEGEAEGSREVR